MTADENQYSSPVMQGDLLKRTKRLNPYEISDSKGFPDLWRPRREFPFDFAADAGPSRQAGTG